MASKVTNNGRNVLLEMLHRLGKRSEKRLVGEGKETGDNKRSREPRGNAEHSQIYQATSATAPFEFFL
jgi:hypothetical protein